MSAGGLSNWIVVNFFKLYLELVRCYMMEEISKLDHSAVFPDRVTTLVLLMLVSISFRHRAHVIITRDKTKIELIHYLHGWCFRFTPKTFLKAIKNWNFINLLGLNNQQLLKYLPPVIATALEHLEQERNNLQSTKQVKSELNIEEEKEFYPDI